MWEAQRHVVGKLQWSGSRVVQDPGNPGCPEYLLSVGLKLLSFSWCTFITSGDNLSGLGVEFGSLFWTACKAVRTLEFATSLTKTCKLSDGGKFSAFYEKQSVSPSPHRSPVQGDGSLWVSLAFAL